MFLTKLLSHAPQREPTSPGLSRPRCYNKHAMGVQATYDDANLLLRLYELRREDKLREARAWFVRNYYAATMDEHAAVCPPGSQEDTYFRMVTSYWDMTASLITSGVLNQDLFLESGNELILAWDRLRNVIPAMRAAMSPLLLKNVEQVAQAGIARMEKAQPGGFEKFSARTRAFVNRPRK